MEMATQRHERDHILQACKKAIPSALVKQQGKPPLALLSPGHSLR
jgi:hypothetical protein